MFVQTSGLTSIYNVMYTVCSYDTPQWTCQTDWTWNIAGIIYV